MIMSRVNYKCPMGTLLDMLEKDERLQADLTLNLFIDRLIHSYLPSELSGILHHDLHDDTREAFENLCLALDELGKVTNSHLEKAKEEADDRVT